MKGWEITNLKSIVEFFNGKAIGVRDSGRYKVYGSNGVIGFSEKFKYSDSLIIGRVGAHCGSIFYEKHEYWATDNTIIAKVKEGYYIKYIFHLLNAFPLNDFAGGAAQPLLNQTILGKMVFRIPPFPIQRKIAAILSAYDDLIENNNRRIAILEKMAEELYREWFVRLRFPGHENTKILKGVPEGWEVKKLSEVIELAYGKALKEENRIEGKYPVFGSSGIIGFHNQAMVKGPGIIVGRKGNVGSIAMSDDDFFPIDTAYYVKSKLPLEYLFYFLRGMNFINNDAAVPGLNREQAYSNKFYHPPTLLIEEYRKIVRNFLIQKNSFKQQNNLLTTTRDRLLTRLMSGKIDVENLDIEFPASMKEEVPDA